jgi:FkbM family methyltransferase
MIKQMVKKTARALGYDLRRFSPGADNLNEISLLLRQSLRPVIFDVGAHHGETARELSNLFPSAELYCFEPFPESFAELKKNSNYYPTATLEPIGFSDKIGPHEFNSNASSPTNSLLELDNLAAATWGNSSLSPVIKVMCNFDALDRYLDINKIKK